VKYQALDLYMMRTPVLPLAVYHELRSDNPTPQLAHYAQDPMIREAIAVASTSLLTSLPQLEASASPRKQEQTASGLLRYLIRMATRPTPFGLFSGVAHGRFAAASALKISDLSQHRKRSRPDMHWLLKILERVESDPAVVRQLSVTTNGMAYRHGSRWKLPYVTRYGQRAAGSDTVSVRNSPVVEFVLQPRPTPIPFHQLLRDILEAFPGSTEAMADKFLLQLFEQEFLLSTLRPPTTTTDPYAYVLDELSQLQGVEDLYHRLRGIHERMLTYDALPVGQGESLYLELISEMKELAEVAIPMQVDLALQTEDIQLPETVRADVEQVAEVLWRLSYAQPTLQHLEHYRSEFVERYGFHREIPLLELLDEDIGLGAPASYEYPKSRRFSVQGNQTAQTERDQMLADWLTETLQQGRMELELTEAHIQRLQGPASPNWQEAPTSMELYFHVVADSVEALDRGEYRLYGGGNHGSSMAYKTFGRFADMLDDRYAQALQDATEREEAHEPEAIRAEVSYLPHSGRTTNVVLTRHARAYEIPVGTNASSDAQHTITVDDLVVGANEKHLYLKSRRLNREVIPTATHMLNFNKMPNVCRFLRELGFARYKQLGPFSWGALASASFLPRVRYGRVVLQPAQWRLRTHDAWYADSMTEDAFFQAVQAWRDSMKVPQLVFLSHYDHRMLLDLTQRHHVEELRKELKKANHVTLIETGQMEAHSIVSGSDGAYASEFVFSLIKREIAAGSLARRATRAGYEGPRVYLPGSEWMYLKLYGNESRQDELIATKLIELLSSLSQQGQIDTAYFLRYTDPGVHLRLRLHGKPDVLSANVMPQVHRWSQELQQEGLLSKLLLDTYEPEIERYGGPELMKLAEQVFHADTQVVANWVQAKRFGGWQLAPDLIGVLSVLDYLEQFGYSFSEQVELMDRKFGSKEHLDLFRTYRKTILEQVNGSPDPLLSRMFEFRAPFIKRYAEQARSAHVRGELFGSYEDLVFSVIHMHMNRFCGLDRKQEQKTYTLTRHALQALKHFRQTNLDEVRA